MPVFAAIAIAIIPELHWRSTVIPAVVTDAEVTVNCAGAGPGELVLSFGPEEPCIVTADGVSTLDVQVLLSNSAEDGSRDIQGWSYGVAMDFDDIVAVDGAPGAIGKL